MLIFSISIQQAGKQNSERNATSILRT